MPLEREAYERFAYTIQEAFPVIQRSTLVLVMYSSEGGILRGQLTFAGDITLDVSEIVNFRTGQIEDYGYAVLRGGEILYWYDSQPHPHDPTLASTRPHHKHVPPDMKHHRIPAPGLAFSASNLPFLIHEIEQTLLT